MYELEPDNRNCEDEVLLGDLRKVAAELNKKSITKDDYNAHGRFAAATMQKRFGSWNIALEKSGLEVGKRMHIPSQEFLDDMQRVAQILGQPVVPVVAYRRYGKFSDKAIAKRFGSWIKATESAGLELSSQYFSALSNDELFANMATVWQAVGRQPKKRDFFPPISKVSSHPYVRRFGTWRSALEAFVTAANAGTIVVDAQDINPVSIEEREVEQILSKPRLRRTARDPGWRLRFLVLRRDRFTCKICGRSPALNPGVVLDVDHVLAWSKGGETIMENLQSLCQVCNGGKSDLSMTLSV